MKNAPLYKELLNKPLVVVLGVLIFIGSQLDKETWKIILSTILNSPWLTFIVTSAVFIALVYLWSAIGDAIFDVNRRNRWSKTIEDYEYKFGLHSQEILLALAQTIGKNTVYNGIRHFEFKDHKFQLKGDLKSIYKRQIKWERIAKVTGYFNITIMMVGYFIFIYANFCASETQKSTGLMILLTTFLIMPLTLFIVIIRDRYRSVKQLYTELNKLKLD